LTAKGILDWQSRYSELMGAQDLIAGAIRDVKAVLRNEVSAQARARSLYDLLVQYVAKQDDGFYQALRARYAGNASALKIIEFFLQDLKMLKVKFFIFEDTYLMGRRASKSKWVSDFQEFSEDILTRCQMEQAQLFPLLK
jgi:hypothetical protein